MSTEKKILVTLDGSKRSKRTVDYLCSFKPFRDTKVTLFNITTPVPEAYYDLTRDSFSNISVSQIKAWEMGQKTIMTEFLKEARQKMIAAGYKPDNIGMKLVSRSKGVARGVLDEIKNNEYHSLVIRRRGNANSMLGVTMGGVAAKLVEKASSIPLIIAGTHEIKHYLCIAVDGSPGSKHAIQYTADMMAKTICRILLCAIMRTTVTDSVPEGKDPFVDMSLQAKRTLDEALAEAKQILTQAGIPEDRIETRLIQGAQSRAGALLDKARAAKCDTIVMGRKGVSDVENFDLGRIPRKIIYASRKFTIWLIP
ncbi:universal stress protein [Desulfobacter hydrogenophilus]|uniref:Universal stress protein n=1 Tax=Desulfobacter hydrogenophilus TaxID=2291 RepID=A0A328FHB4_9BACT|nr:universal stress protein [Desulfobacter hydrogenophilus]NDY72770.1 universal stress protein [Desulfobacter hydrogenophilus]QBH13000.1 universal stress protein [Desulfobacter hydrogenophilus]RAM03984.1 universal stress protein [Desulfobacter hydrogenophilus]